MTTKEDIIKLAKIRKQLRSRDIVSAYKISRQYANVLVHALITEGKLLKVGSTNKAFYILPDFASKHAEIFPPQILKRFKNKNLSEHEIIDEIERQYPPIHQLPENVKSIFTYAFSEMLNNAIEHSRSENIEVEISMQNRKLSFVVNDFGIGVYRNIMKKRKLKNEMEAIQDLLQGKTTTKPKAHSGEGIFFTSKTGDVFTLESYGYLLVINNNVNDVFVHRRPSLKHGTRVKFAIATNSTKHLNAIFKKFTDENDAGGIGFNRTEIKVKLYTIGGVHISRSQARRILTGLNKFESIILDFAKVPMVGQAFADEIFRVFHNKYPRIKIIPINMEEGVTFIIGRVSK